MPIYMRSEDPNWDDECTDPGECDPPDMKINARAVVPDSSPVAPGEDCRQYTPLNSNNLVIGKTEHTPPSDITLTNWADPDVLHFTSPSPSTCRPWSDIDEFVIHETAGTRNPQRSLQAEGKSVHFVAQSDGTVTHHNDVVDRLNHADGHDRRSIGMETVNLPEPVPDGTPPDRVISIPPGPKPYAIPTLAQCEAVTVVIQYFLNAGVIPNVWHAVDGTNFRLGKSLPTNRQDPGIYAHSLFSPERKAGGRYPNMYAWLRIVKDFLPDQAYEIGKVLMEEGRFVSTRFADGRDLLVADISQSSIADAANQVSSR
jgi:hypothetical protein